MKRADLAKSLADPDGPLVSDKDLALKRNKYTSTTFRPMLQCGEYLIVADALDLFSQAYEKHPKVMEIASRLSQMFTEGAISAGDEFDTQNP